MLTGRLHKLAVRATPGNDDKDTKAARRQRRPQRRPAPAHGLV
jgi:hypothetical protein